MRRCTTGVLCMLLILIVTGYAFAAATPTATVTKTTYYFPDKPFPQFIGMWNEGWSLKDEKGEQLIYAKENMPLGGYVFIYFRNTSKEDLKITDLTMQGVKLSQALEVSNYQKQPSDKFIASLHLSQLPKEKIDMLKEAGAPVWWKPEPMLVPAGSLGEIVVRLRRAPKVDKLNFGIIGDKATISAVVDVKSESPRFATIAFNPALDTVYMYVRHPKGAMQRPKNVYMDGRDVTSMARIAPYNIDTVPIVLKLKQPLPLMSYHQFGVRYSDGSQAMAGIRAWGSDMLYGMWGASFKEKGTPEEQAKAYLRDWATHNINLHMGHSSGPTHDFFSSEEGWKFCESLGIGRMITYPAAGHRATYLFLMDEPDAGDASQDLVPPTERLGVFGQYLVKWQDVLHRKGPESPVLLNVDNTYKPENWYMYHQIPDIPCIDPYYPEQLDMVYRKHPGRFGFNSKPTYVYAAATISQSACQPKPLHVILCSTQYLDPAKEYKGRYPTPAEARIEVAYAISAGAKALSYWWYSPDAVCHGCGSGEPEAEALWKEIGLLGAEVRTAGPVITVSCPAELPSTSHPKLWVRSLLSGIGTAMIVVGNDDILCDRVGTVYKPVEKAKVTVELPFDVKKADVFEINYRGIQDVTWKLNGQKTEFDLGTVDLTRFIIVTTDQTLKQKLTQLYSEKFAANVEKLLAEQ